MLCLFHLAFLRAAPPGEGLLVMEGFRLREFSKTTGFQRPDGFTSNTDQCTTPPPRHHTTSMSHGQLPIEVLVQIVNSIPCEDEQVTLWACTLVSRAWYDASIAELYSAPIIETRNFQRFVRTVCPSINAHVRHSACADLIRVLDLSLLVHDSNNSLTARLLGRTKENLEEFVAPAASFA